MGDCPLFLISCAYEQYRAELKRYAVQLEVSEWARHNRGPSIYAPRRSWEDLSLGEKAAINLDALTMDERRDWYQRDMSIFVQILDNAFNPVYYGGASGIDMVAITMCGFAAPMTPPVRLELFRVGRPASVADVRGPNYGDGLPPIPSARVPFNPALAGWYVEQMRRGGGVWGPRSGLTVLDPAVAARQTLKGGRIHIDALRKLVPEGVPDTFKPSITIPGGSKFKYEVNGMTVEIKWHAPDAVAAKKFPGSNSGLMWTAQIRIGKKLLGLDGNLYNKPSDLTHIPIDF